MHWIDISEAQDGSRFINLATVRHVERTGERVEISFGGDEGEAGATLVAQGAAAERLRVELGVLADGAGLERAVLKRAGIDAKNQRDLGYRR